MLPPELCLFLFVFSWLFKKTPGDLKCRIVECLTEPKVSEKKKIAEKIKEKEKQQKKKQEELKKRVIPVSLWVGCGLLWGAERQLWRSWLMG